VGILLGLLSALSYGAGDFCNGIAGRRSQPATAAIVSQPFGIAAAVLGLLLLGDHRPAAGALLWGALAGVGSGIGSYSLLVGLARGRMSVVAPLSGVLAAGLPAVVGLATGDRVSAVTAAGLVLAVPAIVLVAAEPGGGGGSTGGAVVAGMVAGAGFGLLFVALDRAGTGAGAWPLVPDQVVATAILAGVALTRRRAVAASAGAALVPAVAGGVLAGLAALLYLAATGHGELSVIAVVSALYPAATVLLARVALRERWSRSQAAGLGLAVVAVVAISAG
jgi:uncharacterized membrane protein